MVINKMFVRFFVDRNLWAEVKADVLISGLTIELIVLSTLYFFLTFRERKATGKTREEEIVEKFATEEYIKKFEE